MLAGKGVQLACYVHDGGWCVIKPFILQNVCCSGSNKTSWLPLPNKKFIQSRKIYFFSISSKRHEIVSKTRFLVKENDGHYILWRHITDLYYTDLQSGGKTCPRLTVDHIKLNPYSRMTVKFAAQALSESVSKNLREWGTDASGTAEFCEHMGKFFDCLNSRSTSEATWKRKPFCEPFRRADDPRLDWLENVFLKYLDDWKASIQSRVGEFTQTDRNRMFISANTYTGIEMTIRSTLELVPYLLNSGFDFVLTERFCQDCLEEHFWWS